MNRLGLLLLFAVFISCIEKRNEPKKNQSEVQLLDSMDQVIFKSFQEISRSHSFESLQKEQRIVEVGKIFLQTPYVGGTLEQGEEKLVINFRELDCTTFLENVVALSAISRKAEFTETDFLNQLLVLRYRNGNLTDYSSRLHYFSDWIHDNEQKGIIKNVTDEIGGKKYSKEINFMSTHIGAYTALKSDSSMVDLIKDTEFTINKREHFYIPENEIQEVEGKILNGDLIAITTKIKGLDISHVGIAVHMNGRLHLMHASSDDKKVVISDEPLADMLLKNKLQSGIMVARIN